MSPLRADDDRLSRAFREPSRDARGTGGCPAPEALRAAVATESPAAERRAVLDHVATCPACAVAWNVARDLDEGAVSARRSRRAVWSTLAAAAVLAFALLWLPRSTPERPAGSEWRSTTPAYDWTAAPVETTLGPGATTLRWPAGPDGTRYDVRVTDANLEPIDRAWGLDRALYAIPPDRLAGLEPGATLLWQVEAVLPDGTRAVSPTLRATWSPG